MRCPRSTLLIAVAAAFACAGAAGAGAQSPTPVPVVFPEEPEGIAPPSLKGGATTARIVVQVKARARPGAGRAIWQVGMVTGWARQEQVLMVLGSADGPDGREWVRVLLPVRPNGTAGWIPRDTVVLGHSPYWIAVRTRPRTLRVYRRGKLVRRYRAVIGKRSTPTPNGLAAIYERVKQPKPKAFLGPWVLSITALSNVLQEFGGSSGRIGIHGRAGQSLLDPLGSARSHGCIRVTNPAVAWLAKRVPPGTPVRLSG